MKLLNPNHDLVLNPTKRQPFHNVSMVFIRSGEVRAESESGSLNKWHDSRSISLAQRNKTGLSPSPLHYALTLGTCSASYMPEAVIPRCSDWLGAT